MMPAQTDSISNQCLEGFVHNTVEHCVMEKNTKNEADNASCLSDIQDCSKKVHLVSDYQMKTIEKSSEACKSTDECSAKKETMVLNYVELNTSSSKPSTENLMCLNKPDKLLDDFELNISNEQNSYCKKSVAELNKYSLKQLQVLVEDLTQFVEQVSSTLVQLLLENDALQQESDARNIAIEQLLKMTVKVNENDLKPIQMSVILPDDDDDDDDCDVI